VTFSELYLFLLLLVKPIAHSFFIALLKFRYFFLKSGVKFRMCLCKVRIICLQRGYLTGDEPNLRTNFIFWRIAINHPVQIFNVIFESYHNVIRDLMPNLKQRIRRAPGGQACKCS
jgi:hypothetical protein